MKSKYIIIAVSFAMLLQTEVSMALTTVEKLVAKKAAIVSILHKKAKKALVNAAQDKAYAALLHPHASGQNQHLKTRVDEISLNVQRHFNVAEMCLIDPNGHELSWIVGNRIAHDLSEDETSTAFFRPGFEKNPRTVYISDAYMSPDADKWVLAYVTPIAVDGEKLAILHYEHGLDVYQNAINKGITGADQFILAVSESGSVVADSRKTLSIAKRDNKHSKADYFEKFQFRGKGLTELTQAIDRQAPIAGDNGDSYNAAYRKVENWTLVALAKHDLN